MSGGQRQRGPPVATGQVASTRTARVCPLATAPATSKERDPATTAYRYKLDDLGYHLCDVRILTERGRVVDYTVLYLATINGSVMPVVRYDSVHGYPHRDTLDWDGRVVEKRWTPLESLDTALDATVVEVKTRWREFFHAFLERRPRQ